MNYIILDMEWNQPSSKYKIITDPIRLTGEIIQFGAVRVNESFVIEDTFKIGIQPKYYTKMNTVVHTLTKISDEDLNRGYPFKEAFSLFKTWCGSNFIFLTWGYDDIPMLRDNMTIHGLDTDWIPDFYNLQLIFNEQISKENTLCSLTRALDIIQESGRDAHDALNDAINTYIIGRHLDIRKGIFEYDSLKKKMSVPPKKTSLYRDILNAEEFTSEEAMEIPFFTTFPCPSCKKNIKPEKWLTQSYDKKISSKKCSCGREYFFRIRFAKNKKGKLRLNRNVYLMDDSHKKYYNVIRKNKE